MGAAGGPQTSRVAAPKGGMAGRLAAAGGTQAGRRGACRAGRTSWRAPGRPGLRAPIGAASANQTLGAGGRSALSLELAVCRPNRAGQMVPLKCSRSGVQASAAAAAAAAALYAARCGPTVGPQMLGRSAASAFLRLAFARGGAARRRHGAQRR